jgi:Amt family ammonium transporter
MAAARRAARSSIAPSAPRTHPNRTVGGCLRADIFGIAASVSVQWVLWGFSIAFSSGGMAKGAYNLHSVFGSLSHGAMRNISTHRLTAGGTYPANVQVMFQLTFAIITVALVTGAYAERMRYSAALLFSSLWLAVVYCPLAHMVWGGDGALLHDIGALDFAGGLGAQRATVRAAARAASHAVRDAAPAGPPLTRMRCAMRAVVHISSGTAGLVTALCIGKRAGYPRIPRAPHSLVLSHVGAALLWVGWFGFNAGSAGAAGFAAGQAMLVTHTASAMGAVRAHGRTLHSAIRTLHLRLTWPHRLPQCAPHALPAARS